MSGGKLVVMKYMMPFSTTRETTSASTAAISASKKLSISNCHTTGARRADREPDADLALARDQAREQQVRHVRAADQEDEPEREEQRHEHQHGLCRPRHRAELRREHEARRWRSSTAPPRSAARCESHAMSCASACPCDTPGASRPTIVTPPDPSPGRSRNWSASEYGAQKSGAATISSPRKPSGITPTT